MVSNTIIVLISLIFLVISLEFRPSNAQPRIRVGYYWYEQDSSFLLSDINSTLFTHLVCGFARVNSTTNQLYVSPSDEKYMSIFTNTVKQKNPSVTTLLTIGSGTGNATNSSMLMSNSAFRKSFIESSIRLARLYGFQGLDIWWISPDIISLDMINIGVLLQEWRAAIVSEARNSNKSQMILTAMADSSPNLGSGSYPIGSFRKYLDWVHIMSSEYTNPEETYFTGAHAALYNPTINVNTDHGLTSWINAGLSANKLVLCLPFYGFAWTLVNPRNNGIGAPATGPAITEDGAMTYKSIKNYIKKSRANNVTYNSSYVVNYMSIGRTWIGFDDVKAVQTKVSYAKEKGLLGYFVWQISYDDNWVLSQAAADQERSNFLHQKDNKQPRQVLVIVFTIAAAILLISFVIYFSFLKKLKLIGRVNFAKESKNIMYYPAAAGDFNSNVPNLIAYSLVDIEAATEKFSIENKLGQGGYGPVYKGILPDGQVIAVKKLSKASTQGFEEFKNEIILTAKLQHVNLVRLLGFCIDREEQLLIYEYMPYKSLDYYLFDPVKQFILDWSKRVDIIEGVCQGLLYLQEYSRLTIIHRDLKASNVLLDENMKPKISDFGMARVFSKDDLEANTVRIVGTYGYVPPEYVKRGIYSTKSDVYSFGILLLQIISGKMVSYLYGENENLTLLEYAHELWKDGRGMEFLDPSLDDLHSSCKKMRCLQIALLCVQEIPNDRPNMLEVSSMLKNETKYVKIPKKPAFSKQTNEDEEQNDESTSKPELCSVSDEPFTEVLAR